MSGRRQNGTITRHDAESLERVRGWLAAQPGADPLALGVLADITERVVAGALTAAVVRIRAKNLGHRANPSRAAAPPPPERGVWHRWSDEDRDRLATLFRAGKHVDVIADEMGKSQGAIEDQIARLGLWHSRPKPLPRQIHYRSKSSPLSRAKQVLAERRRQETMQSGLRREWCDD
jgi:hypothetical protein